jgi:hypothetical protein
MTAHHKGADSVADMANPSRGWTLPRMPEDVGLDHAARRLRHALWLSRLPAQKEPHRKGGVQVGSYSTLLRLEARLFPVL